MSLHYLYIIYSASLDEYYTGVSHDPEVRLGYHNSFPKGYTRRGRPWRLEFTKGFVTREEALKWERWIKRQKDRKLIEKIIRGEFDWEK
ncbi:MAG: GIY-YIG nuclease family protein [Calditrichaeota bacterium]|nr:MAG: GIY-YIG nuclease family protein [Calditrichota bacterium]